MKTLYTIFAFAILFIIESKATPLPSFDEIRKELARTIKKQDSLNKIYTAQGNAHLCEYLILFNCQENKQLALTDPVWIKQIGTKPLLSSSNVTEIQNLLKNFNQSSTNPIKVYNLVLMQSFTSDKRLKRSEMANLHFTEVSSINRYDNDAMKKTTKESVYEQIETDLEKLVNKTFEDLAQSSSTDLICYTYSWSITLDSFVNDWDKLTKRKVGGISFEKHSFLKGQIATNEIQQTLQQYLSDNTIDVLLSTFQTIKYGLETLMSGLKYAFADKSPLRVATPNEVSMLNTRVDANRAFITPNMSKPLDEVDVESIGTDYIYADIISFDIEKKCLPFTKKELNEKLTYLNLSGYEFYVMVDKYNLPFTQADIEQRATSIFNSSKLSATPNNKGILLLAVASNEGGYTKAGSWRIALVGGNGVPHLAQFKSAIESIGKVRQLEDLGMRIYETYAQLPKRQIIYAYAFTFRNITGSPVGAQYLWQKKISLEANQTQLGCGNAIQIAIFQTEKNRPVELYDFNKKVVVKAKNGLPLEVKEKYIKGEQDARQYAMEIVKKGLKKTIINTNNSFCQRSTYFHVAYMQGNEDPTPIKDFFDGVVEFGAPMLSLLGPEGMAVSWLVGGIYYGAQGRWKEASLNLLFSIAPDLLMATVPRAIEKVNLYILQNHDDITKLASHTWDDLPASAQTFKNNINKNDYQYTVFQEGTVEHIAVYKQTGEVLVAEVKEVGKYKVLKYEQNNSLPAIYTQPATNDAKAGALLQYYKGLLGNTIDEIDLTNIAAHTITTPSNTMIDGIVFKGNNVSGGIVDVIIHANGGGGYKLWINGVLKDVNQKTVAGVIKELIPSDRTVRILSCNSVAAVTRLSAVLPNYELHAIDAIVRIHSDGGVSTIPFKAGATWKKIKNGAVIQNENAPTPAPPVGEKAMREYVEMMFWRKSIQKLDSEVLNASISKVKVDYPVFDFVEDGCHFRANLVAEELMSKGIKCKKIWAFGDWKVPSPYIANKSTADPAKVKLTRWSNHVAVIVEGTLEGNATKLVIDPAFSDTPMSISAWLNSFSPNNPMAEITNLQLLKADYDVAKASGMGNYFINSSLNAGKELKGTKIDPKGYIYFETGIENLLWSDVGTQIKRTFKQILESSKEALPIFSERKRLAILATEVYGGNNNALFVATLADKVKYFCEYRPTLSISTYNNLLNSSFAPTDMKEAVLWLYGNRKTFSDANYAATLSSFRTSMTAINGNYQVFKQKYLPLVLEVQEWFDVKKGSFMHDFFE